MVKSLLLNQDRTFLRLVQPTNQSTLHSSMKTSISQ